MDTNMKASLCKQTLDNAVRSYPALMGMVIHSVRGTQYTSETYRKTISKYGISQSMNSAGGRCHDNARCESMRARMKEELLYDRYDTGNMTIEELKTLIWGYFITKVTKHADELHIKWPLDFDMTDNVLDNLMFLKDKSATDKRMPDFGYIRKELLRNGVNKKLLWVEYCEGCRMSGDEPLMYS